MPALTRRQFLRNSALAGASLFCPNAAEAFAAPSWPEAAAILRNLRAPFFPPVLYLITNYGVRPSPAADARPAIQAAIADCNRNGGGRVQIPPGHWRVDGPLHLLSNVDLHLEDGAVVVFTPDPALYLPVVLTRFEGTEVFNFSPCIYAYQAVNIGLTGHGTIDGSGAEICADWRKRQGPDRDRLRRMGAEGVPVEERIFGRGHWLRFGLIQFLGCTQVLVEDVAIVRSAFWCIHAVASAHVTVRRARVDGPLLNNDCFDPESCSDVLIEDCRFRSGDDCIAIKSGRDQDGWRLGRPSERILIRNCDLSSVGAAAVAIGSEMSGGVREVYVENCRVGHAGPAVNIKGNLDRGGIVERIRVRRLSADSVQRLIEISSGYQGLRGGGHPPLFRDIELSELTCRSAQTAVVISGSPGAEVQNVRLRNITVEHAAKPLEMSAARQISFDGVRINGELIRS